MPAVRNRPRAEWEADDPPQPPILLSQMRNMWQFANITQFMYIFGDALKIDKDLDSEVQLIHPDLETIATAGPDAFRKRERVNANVYIGFRE